MDRKLVGSISYFAFAVSLTLSFVFALPFLAVVQVPILPFDRDENGIVFTILIAFSAISLALYVKLEKEARRSK